MFSGFNSGLKKAGTEGKHRSRHNVCSASTKKVSGVDAARFLENIKDVGSRFHPLGSFLSSWERCFQAWAAYEMKEEGRGGEGRGRKVWKVAVHQSLEYLWEFEQECKYWGVKRKRPLFSCNLSYHRLTSRFRASERVIVRGLKEHDGVCVGVQVCKYNRSLTFHKHKYKAGQVRRRFYFIQFVSFLAPP